MSEGSPESGETRENSLALLRNFLLVIAAMRQLCHESREAVADVLRCVEWAIQNEDRRGITDIALGASYLLPPHDAKEMLDSVYGQCFRAQFDFRLLLEVLERKIEVLEKVTEIEVEQNRQEGHRRLSVLRELFQSLPTPLRGLAQGVLSLFEHFVDHPEEIPDEVFDIGED